MTRPVWSAGGLEIRQALEHLPEIGLTARTQRVGSLSPELARSLRDWLTWWLDDDGTTPPPADPDAVRLAIEEQQQALRKRSLQVESEDFRAGLAWADNALTAVYTAAGGSP